MITLFYILYFLLVAPISTICVFLGYDFFQSKKWKKDIDSLFIDRNERNGIEKVKESCNYILGISAFYHDSAACLLKDGEIIGAVQEERFTRCKNDNSFPFKSIEYLIQEAFIDICDIDIVVFYDNPRLKFKRIIKTYLNNLLYGRKHFAYSFKRWIRNGFFGKRYIKSKLREIGENDCKIIFSKHHLSHSASAFFPSPFQDSAIVTIDGVGEFSTVAISHGKDNDIKILKEIYFPHSLGLLYSAFTSYCGFKVNEGEYKLMGLSSYGNSNNEEVKLFKKIINDHLIDIKEDGSFIMNIDFFNYTRGLTTCNDKKWENIFGISRRKPESEISMSYINLSKAIQNITEDVVIKLAKYAKKITGSNNIVMAGGVSLNCVANGALWREKVFDDIWIQPASGDAGGALGAALSCWHISKGMDRYVDGKDKMKNSLLGPSYDEDYIRKFLDFNQVSYSYHDDSSKMFIFIAKKISEGRVVGLFNGRMEFGPRSLGSRSILGHPGLCETQKKMNLKIKFRESFRPFAPAIMEEYSREYFEMDKESPYMLFVAPVSKDKRLEIPSNYDNLSMFDKLYVKKSLVPAITHVDFSARFQTVSKDSNLIFWNIINEFRKITGIPLIVNTSFNVRGEPIVCTPEDAYNCFIKNDMDILVMENFVIEK